MIYSIILDAEYGEHYSSPAPALAVNDLNRIISNIPDCINCIVITSNEFDAIRTIVIGQHLSVVLGAQLITNCFSEIQRNSLALFLLSKSCNFILCFFISF